MPHVAFIGLGRMGHGMAGRYLDAGFTVAVWNRSRAKAEDLIARGARWASSPADAAIDADAVVTMVADDEAARAVWLGTDGAATTMKAGTLAIECSTVSYQHALDMARELNGRGLIFEWLARLERAIIAAGRRRQFRKITDPKSPQGD